MSQNSSRPGFGQNFIENLPVVPQATKTTGFKPNHLETLIAQVVPPNTFLPVPNHPNG